MEWNIKSPLQWEWENHGLFSGRESEICVAKPGQPVGWRAEGGVTIGNGSVYSSELGNGSSKSSVSASIDSSSKAGGKNSGFNFDAVDGFPNNLNKNNELARMEDTGTSPVGEPLTCLKLGKRTYFEDVCAGNIIKNSTSSTSPAPTAVSVKKTRVSHQSILNSRCQVEGCNIDLSGAKDYHRKHRVCESHSKCPRVVVAGQERRFCQQCSRFHDLTEFDQKKRSCRRRLSDHNARRRKPQADTISFNSSKFSSSFYDDRQQMNFLLTGGPFGSVRPTTSGAWEDLGGFSITHAKGSWAKSTKAGGIDGQLQFSGADLANAIPTLPHHLDKLLPFRGSTAEVLNQGIEASVPASNLEGAPDFRRALSLLSTTDSWGSVNPSQSNFAHLIVNTSLDGSVHPPMHAMNNSTSGYWQDQQQTTLPHQARALPFDLHINPNNGNSQFQDFQLSKATTYEASFFDSGQMISKPDGHILEFKT